MMNTRLLKVIQLITILMIGMIMMTTVVVLAHRSSDSVMEQTRKGLGSSSNTEALGPIPPPSGYPKLTLSTMQVSPTLASTSGVTLEYVIHLVNTGAYPATDVTLTDTLPSHTTFDGHSWSAMNPPLTFTNGVISWHKGQVGFDSSVEITFSLTLSPGFSGILSNTAVINDPQITQPVTLTADARITDDPIFNIAKTASPEIPGPDKPLTYALTVTNHGQPSSHTPISVMDIVPADTTLLNVGQGGFTDPDGQIITWTQPVSLALGETSVYTFSVLVGNVPSGTVLHNGVYLVDSEFGLSLGEPLTTTVLNPDFILSKTTFPDPPGANREMTYTISVLNMGSLATGLVVTDKVPSGLAYLRGGVYDSNGGVTWHLPSLDTRQSAEFSYVVYVPDIAGIDLINNDFKVCSAEGICKQGAVLSSLLFGPVFKATAALDPIAKKPGGGTGPVTPTLTVENLGPGNALDATALITLGRINKTSLVVVPNVGTLMKSSTCDEPFPCENFLWTGDISVGEVITFTTLDAKNSIGGAEGTHYTATIVISDDLSGYLTEPITATAIGNVTHEANLIPTKSAPPQISPGGIMTYTIQVFDSGLTTAVPPQPVLTETVPTSVTLLSVSDGGVSQLVDGRTVISWTLPAMGPGDLLYRTFKVQVNPDLVSGTQIINADYGTAWIGNNVSGILSNQGEPVTTTVHEVGLIDSYKTVTPAWAMPGEGTVLTYVVHVVNSGPYPLSGVQVSDIFPWQNSTYQRDGQVSAGSLVSDIVSLEWSGDVDAYSQQLITFTARVDDFFEGVLTNTALIHHDSLQQDLAVDAVAYIVDHPVLKISKIATPNPVLQGNPLLYALTVTNLGRMATELVVTDTLPVNIAYIDGTATGGGARVGDVVYWTLPSLNPDESASLSFQGTVLGGKQVVNDAYAVRCAEGEFAYGEPVITAITQVIRHMFFPITFK